MRSKEVKFPLTPITEETFIRQGWSKCDVNEPLFEEFGEDLDEGEHLVYVYDNFITGFELAKDNGIMVYC